MKTQLVVRVQASGGMLLGPDSFGGAAITISDRNIGKVLCQGLTNAGDSGSKSTTWTAGATPCPIVTPQGDGAMVNWVVPSSSSVMFAASLDLDAPTLLEIAARVPLPADPNAHLVQTTMWALPGMDQTTGAGIVLEVPGLWVQPEIVQQGTDLHVRAKVTMMCGCELNANSPWLPADFTVNATVSSLDPKAPWTSTLPMTFQVNSQFYADFSLPSTGNYQVLIDASQSSTSNTGAASLKLTI